MGGPQDYKQLEQLLRERFDDLTPQQQRLAQRLLSDPEGCASQTVTQLAESANVDASTVVRFAASLGLKGYPDLARLCQERLRARAQLVERLGNLAYLESIDAGLLPAAATFDQANIAQTFAGIDEQAWERACDLLGDARLIQIVGLRKSSAPASLLGYLLRLVRDDVQQLDTGPDRLPDALRRLRSGDVLVAMSIHRYVRSTLEALEVARRQGASTLVITDNPASPLSAFGDVVFYVEVSGVSILRSVTAMVSLVQALAGGVATRLGLDTGTALGLEEELLSEFGVYVPGPDSQANPRQVAQAQQRPPSGLVTTEGSRS